MPQSVTGFEKRKFGDIAQFKNGLNFSAHSDSHPIKVLGVGDFLDRIKLNDVSSLKSVNIGRSASLEELLKDGDLVFVRSNGKKELVGRCLQVYPGNENVSYSGFTIRARIIAEDVSSDYVALLMAGGLLRTVLRREGAGTNISNLNQQILASLAIPIPDLNVQNEIVQTFSYWDKVIEKLDRLILLKSGYYNALATELIVNTPTRYSISDLATEVSARNTKNQYDRVLSVTNSRGFVLAEKQFERRVASINVSTYKIVKRRQYAYNPSRINVGSIARLEEWDYGILSPMYVVFKLDDSKINSDYFLHWLNISEARQRIRLAAQGSVRETVSFSDLGSIQIPLPEIRRQKMIADLLNLLKHELKLLKQLRGKYKEEKYGLIQKLFTANYRREPNSDRL